jgi:predicted nuclease of predicted toxin-antitoxin system
MKLLFDQNISYRIVRLVKAKFPNCVHVSEVNLINKTDSEIWQFANDNNFTIVTFDADFYDLAVIKGIPPKIIWLRIGNSTSLKISHILIQNRKLVLDFCSSKNENICLELA